MVWLGDTGKDGLMMMSRWGVAAIGLGALLLASPLATAADERISGRFILESVAGLPVMDDVYEGKVRMITFGYTYCPDICPTTLATMAATLDKLGAEADQVAPIFITIDPERDTGPHLKEYLAAFHPQLIGLTGKPAFVAGAARSYKVAYRKNPPTDGDPAHYTMDHSAGIYIMGRDGRFLAKALHDSSVEALTAKVRAALR